MNKTAVQQIVERLNQEAENHLIQVSEELDDKEKPILEAFEVAFKKAASIAAEFLEQEKKEMQNAFIYGNLKATTINIPTNEENSIIKRFIDGEGKINEVGK